MNESPEPVDLSPSRAELIARVRTRGRQIRARRRLGAAGIAVVVAFGIAAPAIAIGTRSDSKSVPPATVSTTRLPPTASLSVRIELPSRTLVSGSNLAGTLVVENSTSRSIELSPHGCPKWAVTLESATLANEPIYKQDCANRPRIVTPGTNRWPFTIDGLYFHCADGTHPVGEEPSCPGLVIGLPHLPAGDYRAVLYTNTPEFLPEAPPVPVRVVATGAPNYLGPLTLRSGARSTKLLVPSGWTRKIEDGGGSGSGTTWTNPDDPNEHISGTTGVEIGSWWETDGVKGSIKPEVAPEAQVQRVNYTTFLFHIDSSDGYPIDGVWIALVDANGPIAFVSASVQLPTALHSTATTILNRFISDTNARVPPFPGPPSP